MPSTLSWLDHSDYERRKAIEVIKLFEERNTVDELGIGTVRDAISDLLFPGTSVLQPRARYFLIVPWVYEYLEAKKIPSAEIAAKARSVETDLIEEILTFDESSAPIGRLARKKLKLLPSTMYWAGLGAWGIRVYSGGQTDYHRWLDRYYRAKSGSPKPEDGERVTESIRSAWSSSIPDAPDGFPRVPLSLELTKEEAKYLQERILSTCGGTLLAHLVDRCKPAEDADFVWMHPEYAGFSDRHKAQLEHGRNLSELASGAVRLYNLMVAEKCARPEWIDAHREAFEEWCQGTSTRRSNYQAWNRNDFWATVYKVNPRIGSITREFVDAWFDLALGPNLDRLVESKPARRLIEERELRKKGKLARLHNELARKNWGGESGIGKLSYRWNPQVRQVTTDIQRGLGRA